MRVWGRGAESAALDRLLDGVRAGRGAALVLRGPPGIGKSVLLAQAGERASGCRVLRAAGVESEMEWPFASLHQLCAPLLDEAVALPEPQRQALAHAFGVGSGAPRDQFVLGLAVLNLLSVAAERQPVLCVVDDAHWLDRSSALALGFVARRIGDEPVGLVLAERDGEELDALAGLPELRLDGLSDADARALLAASTAYPLDERIRDRIVAETRGNPLALLELPRGLGAAGLDFMLDSHGLSLPTRIEASFRRQVAALPPDTQRLLLAAAAEPLGDPTLLWGALARLGLGVEAAAPAETTGLLEVGARITFRHPLLRSAVYRAASPPERRAVHAALAEVTDPEHDPDRRIWHRAQATAGPDEPVAQELERAAARALVRGSVPVAAAFLERATALTLDRGRRAARALATAQAKQEAGAFDEAVDFLGIAESSGALDARGRAHAALVRGQITFNALNVRDAVPLLLDAAERLLGLDPALARETLRDAFHAAFGAGRVPGDGSLRALAAAVRAAPPARTPAAPSDLLLDATAVMFGEDPAAGARLVRAALAAYRTEELSVRDGLAWLPLACRMALNVFDAESWDVLSARLVELVREAGALAWLPMALGLRINKHLLAGEFDVAATLNAEAQAISDATGRGSMASYGIIALAAWQGREQATQDAIACAQAETAAQSAGQWLAATHWARAVLYNGLGRFHAALVAAEKARATTIELGLSAWTLLELVEAAALGGNEPRAAAALADLIALARVSETEWSRSFVARARALTAPDDSLYREALARSERTGMRADVARVHLLYGEWLRRAGRRSAARGHLRTAHELFAAMGAAAFADRAARSLLATGEKARRRVPETRDDLTPQEAQIAELARQGHSNPEIGARLFISPRTVEYHLHKVFAKLNITSRTQLETALPHASRPHGRAPDQPSPGRLVTPA